MRLITEPRHLSEVSDVSRSSGKIVAMVPTMGALHVGHQSLFVRAKESSDVVIASIFVNKLQFNSAEDFEKYPHQLAADQTVLEQCGVDFLYAPSASAMYGPNFSTSIDVGGLADILEGASRPGHFSGVATVVAKLLSAGRPHLAIFGQKDFQQFAVINRLVSDLDLPIQLSMAPTVREPDGLAMSSRNVRLSPTARRESTSIYRALERAKKLFEADVSETSVLIAAARDEISLTSAEIDYVVVVDPSTLEPVVVAESGCVILIAVNFEGVRLIDNLILGT